MSGDDESYVMHLLRLHDSALVVSGRVLARLNEQWGQQPTQEALDLNEQRRVLTEAYHLAETELRRLGVSPRVTTIRAPSASPPALASSEPPPAGPGSPPGARGR